MEFPVHLRCSAVVAIVDCPDQGQFIRFLSLKQAALQSIWVFQESPISTSINALVAFRELEEKWGHGVVRQGKRKDQYWWEPSTAELLNC